MRNYLASEKSVLQANLTALTATLVRNKVIQPWGVSEMGKIIIRKMMKVLDLWGTPNIYYSTFAKMLRENGIPMNGKAFSENLNRDILRAMESYIQRWNNNMLPQAESLAVCLEAPVQLLLKSFEQRLNALTGDPEMKRTATEALISTPGRIGVAFETLRALLQSNLRDVYFRYMTEDNICCPRAQAMRPKYRAALQETCLKSGADTYARAQTHLRDFHDTGYQYQGLDTFRTCAQHDRKPGYGMETVLQ